MRVVKSGWELQGWGVADLRIYSCCVKGERYAVDQRTRLMGKREVRLLIGTVQVRTRRQCEGGVVGVGMGNWRSILVLKLE